MLVLSLLGFLYQASEIMQEYLEHRSAVDLRIEGSGTLLYPGLSYCLTNWYVAQTCFGRSRVSHLLPVYRSVRLQISYNASPIIHTGRPISAVRI